MAFRRPTEQELCNTLSGNNWAKQLLRRLLVVDEDDPCKWATCTATNDNAEPDPQIETNGYAILCDAAGNSYLVHNVHDELEETNLTVYTPLDGAPEVTDSTGLGPCKNPQWVPTGCAEKEGNRYKVWKLFNGTVNVATLAIGETVPFVCEPYVEGEFTECEANVNAADSCYFEWNNTVNASTFNPGFNFNAVSITAFGIPDNGFIVATLNGVNSGSGEYILTSFSPVLNATLQDNEPLTSVDLAYFEKPAGWTATAANEGKLTTAEMTNVMPECINGIVRLLNQ